MKNDNEVKVKYNITTHEVINEDGMYVARLTLPDGTFVQTDAFDSRHEAFNKLGIILEYIIKQADYEILRRLSEVL